MTTIYLYALYGDDLPPHLQDFDRFRDTLPAPGEGEPDQLDAHWFFEMEVEDALTRLHHRAQRAARAARA